MTRRGLGLLAGALAALASALGVTGYVPTAGASGGDSQCLPLPADAATSSPSASPSASPASPPVLLCLSVRPSESSVEAGRAAGFAVQLQVENGAAPDVSVTLAASAGDAAFSGLCPSGDGTASCQLGPLGTDVTPSSFTLHAQIGTPLSGMAWVSLTASAEVATNPSMTAQATGVMTVTAVPAKAPSPEKTPSPAKAPSKPPSSPPPPPATPAPATVPAVPSTPAGLPAADPAPTGAVSTSTVAAGNVSSMLPVISPAHSSSAATAFPAAAGTASALAVAPEASSGGGGGRSWLTIAGAVVLGLLALALASFLAVTRRGRTP